MSALATVKTFNDLANRAANKGAETLALIWKAGETAKEAKAMLSHGEWMPFVEKHYCVDHRSVTRWIKFHESVPESKLDTVSNLTAGLAMIETPKKRAKTDTDGPTRSDPAAEQDAEQDAGSGDCDDEAPIEGLTEHVVGKLPELKPTSEQAKALAEYTEESQDELVDSVLAGRQTLDEAIERGEVPEVPIDERIKSQNQVIESFCRETLQALTAMASQAGPWVEDWETRFDSAFRQIQNGIKTLRTCKAKAACPDCLGEGCHECFETGMVPKSILDQM